MIIREECKGWEHEIRDRFCTLCAAQLRDSHFVVCEAADHSEYLEQGYDFCPHCAKELMISEKFTDPNVKHCKKCGHKINHKYYRRDFSQCKHLENAENAAHCQQCGKKLTRTC